MVILQYMMVRKYNNQDEAGEAAGMADRLRDAPEVKEGIDMAADECLYAIGEILLLRFQYNLINSGITKWGIFSAKSGYFYYAIHNKTF